MNGKAYIQGPIVVPATLLPSSCVDIIGEREKFRLVTESNMNRDFRASSKDIKHCDMMTTGKEA